MRACVKCGVEQPLSAFPKGEAYKDGHKRECRDCRRIFKQEYDKRDTTRAAYNLRYKVRVEAKATRPRPDHCEVCGRLPGVRALHWDHNHKTGAFRGWLCSSCNAALGMCEDDHRILLRLAIYLLRS